MIYVTETDDEYLVSIPINEKERAKSIDGRRWDPERKVWVYPKTPKILEQLIAEFGDENSKIMVEIPGKENKPHTRTSSQIDEANLLQKILDEIKKAEKEPSPPPKESASDAERYLKQISTLEQQLQAVLDQMKSKDLLITELERKTESSEDQITQLRELLAKKDRSSQNCSVLIKEKAKEATSNDPKFCTMIDNHEINKDLLLDLTNKMHQELRTVLKVDDPAASLHDLIIQAVDADIFSSEASDYAHLIRKERNKIVHDNAYVKTHQARILMCLFAASLLWPNFPE